MKKLIAITFSSLVLSIFIAGTVQAIAISPGKQKKDVDPGTTFETTVTVTNNSDVVSNISVKKADILQATKFLGWEFFIDGESEKTAFSLRDWISFPENYDNVTLDPGEKAKIPVTIFVPEDATPGTHMGAVVVTEGPSTKIETSGSTFGFRLASLLLLNVSGDVNEEASIENFRIDEDLFKQGDVVFKFDLVNKGNTLVSPSGKLEIFDKKTGEQVLKIANIIETGNGTEVITGTRDFLEINSGLSATSPSSTKTYEVNWRNRTVNSGEYVAKIELFYGINNEKTFNDEVEFNISENLSISEFKTDKGFYLGLPVNFTAKLLNDGTKTLEPRGSFKITNVMGVEKYSTELNPKDLVVLGGMGKDLSNNLAWENGFAFGYYNANLKLYFGDTNQVIERTIGFWVLNWWQIIIVILVITVIVYLIAKIVKKYKNLEKQVEDLKKS